MLLKITGLCCKRALYKRLYSAKETYDFKEPTNRSHPILPKYRWPEPKNETSSILKTKNEGSQKWDIVHIENQSGRSLSILKLIYIEITKHTKYTRPKTRHRPHWFSIGRFILKSIWTVHIDFRPEPKNKTSSILKINTDGPYRFQYESSILKINMDGPYWIQYELSILKINMDGPYWIQYESSIFKISMEGHIDFNIYRPYWISVWTVIKISIWIVHIENQYGRCLVFGRVHLFLYKHHIYAHEYIIIMCMCVVVLVTYVYSCLFLKYLHICAYNLRYDALYV